jgi:type II restriction enzyme
MGRPQSVARAALRLSAACRAEALCEGGSAIIKRPPLAATARRAGWVGCSFDLRRIPADARIEIIRTVKSSGTGFQPVLELKKTNEDRQDACPTIIVPPAAVRAQFQKVKPFANFSVEQRGWMLDVLNIVRRICEQKRANLLDCGGKRSATPLSPRYSASSQSGVTAAALQNEFTNDDVYAFSRELEKLHPDNRHIKDKIRQKLQVLRDAKLLVHVGSGVWRLP